MQTQVPNSSAAIVPTARTVAATDAMPVATAVVAEAERLAVVDAAMAAKRVAVAAATAPHPLPCPTIAAHSFATVRAAKIPTAPVAAIAAMQNPMYGLQP